MTHKMKTLAKVTVPIIILAIASCSQNVSVANDSGIQIINKSGGSPGVAGKYDSKEISLDDLEKSNPDIFDAKLKVYQSQRKAVEEYVRNQILDGLAKKAGISTEEFMKKESENAKKKVSAKEVEAFLRKNNVTDMSKVPDHIKDQVKGLLHVQKLVADNAKGKVDFYLKRPTAAPIAFNLDKDPSWGNKDAKVTIVEFSDFQCPFCARGKSRLDEIKKEYGKKVRVVYKNYPLPMHPNARPAAEAAMCINEQSVDKFWKYHDGLFEAQDKMSEDDLKALAKKVGADTKKFEECFAAKKFAANIDASIEEARKAGVDSTPTFFINSQPIRGARDLAEFKEIIDEGLGN